MILTVFYDRSTLCRIKQVHVAEPGFHTRKRTHEIVARYISILLCNK
jgi:hypothetical protein